MEFQFDVDIFDAPRKRIQGLPSNYEVKVCSPEWYLSSEGKDAEEDHLLTKHAADRKFYHGEYKQALDYYSRCAVLVPASNVAAQRDCIEGKARCYLRLGDYDSALKTANELGERSLNSDHKLVVWRLLSEIHSARGDTEEEQAALCMCILLHPETSAFWDKLSACYLLRAISSGHKHSSKAPSVLLTAACLIKTSLLYQGSISGHRSFGKVHNLQKQEEIERLLKDLDLPLGFIEFARKELTAGADTNDNHIADFAEITDTCALPSDIVTSFEKKWFAWIPKFGADCVQ